MLKCILWLNNAEWKKRSDGSYRDKENIYDTAVTGILTYLTEEQQNLFDYDGGSPVFVGILDNNTMMKTALAKYPKPVITVWDKDTNKTIIIPEKDKRNSKAIAKQIKGYLGTKESNNDDGKNDREGNDGGKEGGDGDGTGFLPFGFKRDCNFIDEFFEKLGIKNDIKRLIFGGAAAFCIYKALESGNKAGQIVFGAGGAYLAYLALSQTPNQCTDKEKKKINGIGKLEKSKFIPVYKNYGVPELGWRSETNIKFAQGKPGVYLIKRNNKIVYIGAGANVYKTALRHFEPHPPDSTGKNKQEYWRDYDYNDYTIRIVLTGNRDRAARLEAALINKHLPPDNHHIPELFNDRKTEKIIDEYNDEPPF